MTDDVRGEFEGLWLKSTDAKNENSMLKAFAKKWFKAGRASRELKLPSDLCEILEAYKEYSRRQTYKGSQLSFLAGVEWAKGKIKALNECEGESGDRK